MKIAQFDDRALVIHDCSWWIGLLAFPVGGFALFVLARELSRPAPSGRQLAKAAVVAGLFLFAGVIGVRRTVFHFDLAQRELRWSRRGIFRSEGATVPFDNIRGAAIQTIRNNQTLSYRVAVITADNEELPLSQGYASVAREQCEVVRSAVNKALPVEIPVESEADNDLLEMARCGRKIQAIALARTRLDLSLEEAKQRVEDLLRAHG